MYLCRSSLELTLAIKRFDDFSSSLALLVFTHIGGQKRLKLYKTTEWIHAFSNLFRLFERVENLFLHVMLSKAFEYNGLFMKISE